MNNYEKVASSPETLGEFLTSLSIPAGPWDMEFQKQHCANCLYINCDTCPHEEARNNPTWWLKLDTDRKKANAMTNERDALSTGAAGGCVKEPASTECKSRRREEENTMLEPNVFNVDDQAFRERINEEKKHDAELGWDWDEKFEKGFDLCIKKREFGIMLGALHEMVTPLLSRKKFRVTVIGDPEKDDVRIEYRRD